MDEIAAATDLPKPDFYYTGQVQQTQFKCLKCTGFNGAMNTFMATFNSQLFKMSENT